MPEESENAKLAPSSGAVVVAGKPGIPAWVLGIGALLAVAAVYWIFFHDAKPKKKRRVVRRRSA